MKASIFNGERFKTFYYILAGKHIDRFRALCLYMAKDCMCVPNMSEQFFFLLMLQLVEIHKICSEGFFKLRTTK